MASAIDICNLALAHLGDTATVTSIDPPEGSAQAEHCARFYAIARDGLLAMHRWGFATRRAPLAQLASVNVGWEYAYAQPSDVVSAIAVLSPDAPQVIPRLTQYSSIELNVPRPQFICELDASSASAIFTNQPNAVLHYIARVTDSTRFSPLFVIALSWSLASMLAGPIIKGEAGAAEAKRCSSMMQAYLGQAKIADAEQQNLPPQHTVSWMAGR